MDQHEAPGRKVGVALGLLSGVVALGVAELASVPFGSGSSPILAVGATAIDLSPHWLKTWAIENFGTNDKAVLLAGIGVVLAVVAAVIGVASLRRPRSAAWALAVLGAVGGLAAWARPANGLLDAVPSVAGAVAGLIAYRTLRTAAGLRPRPETPATSEPAPTTIRGYDRRRFLRTGFAVAGLAVAGGGLGRVLARRAGADASRTSALIPAPTDPGAPIPTGADLGLEGMPPFVTPNDRFYRVDTALFVPAVDAADWRLRIHGMVDHEIELGYADLLARPLIERDITLMCVSNEVGGSYIGNARWVGARLDDLLREAGVHEDATQIVTRSVDGFTIGTPTSEVMDGRAAMLAVGMNGEPLPLAHGFPVRMLVPGLYGYVSAMKWVVDMELSTFDTFDAYWIERGWAQEAPIKIGARIDTPREGASVAAGEVVVAGVAWAQHVGVAKVEVQVDGGEWSQATLADQDSVDTWRQWVLRSEVAPGTHSLAVRATNVDGEVQTAALTPPFPDGATGHHTVSVRAS
jgi:DMSO/TMAO reductase YedYZ molybdopterin-dependent catalytic subunit